MTIEIKEKIVGYEVVKNDAEANAKKAVEK